MNADQAKPSSYQGDGEASRDDSKPGKQETMRHKTAVLKGVYRQ